MPEKVEMQVRRLEEDNDVAAVHTNRLRIGTDGKHIIAKNREIPEGRVFNELIEGNFICCSSVMVRRSCFDVVGLFDEDPAYLRSEDYEMWLRLAHKFKVAYLRAPLIRYRVNPAGFSRSDIWATYRASRSSFLKALAIYEGNRTLLEWKISRKMAYLRGHSFFYLDDYQEAARGFLEAFKLNVFDVRALFFCILSLGGMAIGRIR